MGRFFGMLACSVVVLTSIASAKTPEPVSQTKVGPWGLNYDKDACHLTAQFGEGPASTIIRFTRFQPGDKFDLRVYGLAFKFETSTVPVDIGFGIAKPVRTFAVVAKSGNNLPTLILLSQRLDGWEATPADDVGPAIAASAEEKVNSIDLQIPRDRQFRFEAGSLAKPMAAMRACTADLVKSWGYDPDQQASLSVPVKPIGKKSAWLRNGDYPAAALRALQMGFVQFRLDIDAAGKVTGCHVLHRTDPDMFADKTCQLISKRAKFRPAMDRDGKAVASYYVDRARFIIPE